MDELNQIGAVILELEVDLLLSAAMILPELYIRSVVLRLHANIQGF